MLYLQFSSSILFGILGITTKSNFPIKVIENTDLTQLQSQDSIKNRLIAALKKASITSRNVGYAGILSESWSNRALLIHDLSTIEALDLVLNDDASLRITGFMALYYQNYAQLEKVRTSLLDDDATVNIQSGCIVGMDSVSNIVSEIEQWIYKPAIDQFYNNQKK